MRALRTAKSWGKEPLQIIIGSFTEMEPRVWEKINNMFMMAYQIVEDETCDSCGVPYWHGKSTINTVEFKVETATCYSCADLEREREKDGKSKKKSFGETKYVVPVAAEGFELPSRAESYEKMS